MTLATTQRTFMAHIISEDATAPTQWDARFLAVMEIYRNGYRARLVEALQETFPRTCEWVGEESFARAAAHHLITAPPSSWTLDEVGLGLPEVLSELFANDPEVPELAWLEWAMHEAFTATDAPVLDAAGFAAVTASYTDEDWSNLRLTFLPGTTIRPVLTCCDHIWKTLSQGCEHPVDLALPEPAGLVVWREDLSPVFQRIDTLEVEALHQMIAGQSFGSLCEFMLAERGETGIAEAGQMLASWIARGMIAVCS